MLLTFHFFFWHLSDFHKYRHIFIFRLFNAQRDYFLVSTIIEIDVDKENDFVNEKPTFNQTRGNNRLGFCAVQFRQYSRRKLNIFIANIVECRQYHRQQQSTTKSSHTTRTILLLRRTKRNGLVIKMKQEEEGVRKTICSPDKKKEIPTKCYVVSE